MKGTDPDHLEQNPSSGLNIGFSETIGLALSNTSLAGDAEGAASSRCSRKSARVQAVEQALLPCIKAKVKPVSNYWLQKEEYAKPGSREFGRKTLPLHKP